MKLVLLPATVAFCIDVVGVHLHLMCSNGIGSSLCCAISSADASAFTVSVVFIASHLQVVMLSLLLTPLICSELVQSTHLQTRSQTNNKYTRTDRPTNFCVHWSPSLMQASMRWNFLGQCKCQSYSFWCWHWLLKLMHCPSGGWSKNSCTALASELAYSQVKSNFAGATRHASLHLRSISVEQHSIAPTHPRIRIEEDAP